MPFIENGVMLTEMPRALRKAKQSASLGRVEDVCEGLWSDGRKWVCVDEGDR